MSMNAAVERAPAAQVGLNADPESVAGWIARFLEVRGVDRVFGLRGGHIQPIRDHAAARGIRIVDVRQEAAAGAIRAARRPLAVSGGVVGTTLRFSDCARRGLA